MAQLAHQPAVSRNCDNRRHDRHHRATATGPIGRRCTGPVVAAHIRAVVYRVEARPEKRDARQRKIGAEGREPGAEGREPRAKCPDGERQAAEDCRGRRTGGRERTHLRTIDAAIQRPSRSPRRSPDSKVVNGRTARRTFGRERGVALPQEVPQGLAEFLQLDLAGFEIRQAPA